jgi:hypothetical protein
MTANRRSVWLLATLLAGSVALNAWQATHPPRPPSRPTVAAAPEPTAPERPALGGLLPDWGRPAFPAHEPAMVTAVDAGLDEAALNREILAWMARELSRQLVAMQRDGFRMALRDYLGDNNRQAGNAIEKTLEIRRLLGLRDDEARALYDEYSAARLRRVNAMRWGLEQEPVDWSGVFDQVKSLYADEEQIVRERFGDERARRLHDAERAERLAVLATFASLAERPWDDATTP